MTGLNQKRQSSNDDSEIIWDQPFSEDPAIRDGEEAMSKINRKFLVHNISILSTDDDHLRLTSSECEDIGLPRKNNTDKAFGPIATGIVSLTSGITLGTRIAGRGETDIDTIEILTRHLFNKQLSQHIKATNLFAMDHGYLSKSMIDYLSQIGCNMGNRIRIEEHCSKMVYWAEKNRQKFRKTM